MQDEEEYDDIRNDKLHLEKQNQKFVGKKFVFEDGDSIEVVQIKSRGPGQHYITYHIQQGPGISRKLILPLTEFASTYGHLFGSEE